MRLTYAPAGVCTHLYLCVCVRILASMRVSFVCVCVCVCVCVYTNTHSPQSEDSRLQVQFVARVYQDWLPIKPIDSLTPGRS